MNFELCEHLEFSARVAVNRLTATEGGPVTGYSADVTIACRACGLPFHFVGVERGASPREPRISFDGTELRAPIAPGEVA